VIRYLLLPLLTLLISTAHAALYKVQPGKLHQKGKIIVKILPDDVNFRVQMDYQVKKKDYVPVPEKLLNGSKTMDFPPAFRTEAGYKELERKKVMNVKKAQLRFKRRGDVAGLKNAYFIEVRPINKKSKVEIIYHPSLPSVGWYEVDITFLSKIPVLNGYELKAVLRR
jgi:hypothetical protein